MPLTNVWQDMRWFKIKRRGAELKVGLLRDFLKALKLPRKHADGRAASFNEFLEKAKDILSQSVVEATDNIERYTCPQCSHLG